MFALSRVLLIAAVITAAWAIVARFYQPLFLLPVTPDAWLQVTGTLLLFAIAVLLTDIAELLRRKSV